MTQDLRDLLRSLVARCNNSTMTESKVYVIEVEMFEKDLMEKELENDESESAG